MVGSATAMEINFDNYFAISGFSDDIKGKLSLIHCHGLQLNPDPTQLRYWLKLALVSVVNSHIVKHESTLAKLDCPPVCFCHKIRSTLLRFSS